jgi:hypothetical protein
MIISGMTMFSFSPGGKLVLVSTTGMAAATKMQTRTNPGTAAQIRHMRRDVLFIVQVTVTVLRFLRSTSGS